MSRKKLVIILVPTLLLLGIIGVAVRFYHTDRSLSPSQQEQKAAAKQDAAKKEALVTNQNSSSNTAKSDSTQSSATYTPPSNTENVILSASQTADQVVVITKLYNYSDGTCTLTIKNNSQSKTITAPVMFNREYSTCDGFAIPTDTLGTGTWNIALQVTSGGVTTTKDTSLGVQ